MVLVDQAEAEIGVEYSPFHSSRYPQMCRVVLVSHIPIASDHRIRLSLGLVADNAVVMRSESSRTGLL